MVSLHEVGLIHVHCLCVAHRPASLHHHIIGAVSATVYQGSQGVVITRVAQLVEAKQCQVSLQAGCESTNVIAAKASRPAFGSPAQCIQMADTSISLTCALQQHCLADLLYCIGGVI